MSFQQTTNFSKTLSMIAKIPRQLDLGTSQSLPHVIFNARTLFIFRPQVTARVTLTAGTDPDLLRPSINCPSCPGTWRRLLVLAPVLIVFSWGEAGFSDRHLTFDEPGLPWRCCFLGVCLNLNYDRVVPTLHTYRALFGLLRRTFVVSDMMCCVNHFEDCLIYKYT